jgi:AcrR family transcriptional regulator
MFVNGQINHPCLKMATMTTENKKADRRATRTRRSLSDALHELIMEKRFDSITVQNVIDRADVGRSTFYAHYRDKEDLFLSGWQRLLEGFAQHIEWEKAARGERFVPVAGLFCHVQDVHKFYKALARSRKTAMLFKTGHSYLSESIERALTSWLADKPPPSLPVPVVSNYLASEILALLKWWLDHDMPHTPERMDEMFHQLVAPGFCAALGCVEADAK